MAQPDAGADHESRIRLELVLLCTALVLTLVSVVPASTGDVPGWERAVFRAINDLPRFLYRPVWVVMQFGSFWAIVAIAGLALSFRRLRLASALAMAGGAAYLLANALKSIVGRGRPLALLAHVHIRGQVVTGNGYPSGHAAVAFALASVLWLVTEGRLRWIAPIAAIVVCFARVYVGAHFPLDVVGGAALGTACGAGVGLVLRVRSSAAG